MLTQRDRQQNSVALILAISIFGALLGCNAVTSPESDIQAITKDSTYWVGKYPNGGTTAPIYILLQFEPNGKGEAGTSSNSSGEFESGLITWASGPASDQIQIKGSSLIISLSEIKPDSSANPKQFTAILTAGTTGWGSFPDTFTVEKFGQ
jgi:hypothetical protein